MNRRLIVLGVLLGAGLAMAVASCGGDDNGDGGPVDGQGQDQTVSDGGGNKDVVNDVQGGFCNDSGTCLCLGGKCTNNSECCSNNCYQGSCQPPPCTADYASCSSNAQCCGGQCGSTDAGASTCVPLSTTCSTLGNPCNPADGGNVTCCSHFCGPLGFCAQPSYCGQTGDVCASAADCCGGICTKPTTTSLYGLCAQPPSGGAQCSQVDGVVCASTNPVADGGIVYTDSGIPQCGGDCCSRSCAPYGPTSVLICQPASGCHPVGDLCYKDDDCCGGQGGGKKDAGVTVCLNATDGGPGVCSNPTGCKPNGDICRLQTNQCNATDVCCSGNVQQFDTCHQDNLGVPRCSYAGDAGCIPVDAGTQCSSSADCCNLNPCVSDGDGGFTCYPQACVPTTGPCTTDSDCCVGGHCYIPGGKTTGTCQPLSDGGTPDSGPPCALYGQLCTVDDAGVSNCCNGVPCTNGRCQTVVN